MKETIRALQNEFDEAERQADAEALKQLLAADFLSIGPKGFILDKQEWIDRHALFTYHKLDTEEMDIRLYDNTAIVRNIQRNDATYNDVHVQLAVRVSQVWVNQVGEWRLEAIQFSPLDDG